MRSLGATNPVRASFIRMPRARGYLAAWLALPFILAGCAPVEITPCLECLSAPAGTWTGLRVNPVSGESFPMSVQIDDGGQQFIGTVQTDEITFWRFSGRVVNAADLTADESAEWESALGREVTDDLLLIEFEPQSKLEGHFIRGTFRAYVEGDAMEGMQTDGEYEHAFSLLR